jgi:putative spermidine/putrescine transport system permease protein
MMRAPLAARVAANGLASAVLAFLVMPILVVVPAAFNHTSFIRLPPREMSTRWFHAFFSDREWMTSLMTSFEVALWTTALTVFLGTLAALGLERTRGWLRQALMGLFLAPLIVPLIVLAVALYYVGQRAGLVGTTLGLVLGHSLLCLPFVVINVSISLRGVDPNWWRAAEGLGAGPLTVFRTITLPNILPGVFGGGVFAFLVSFDEVVISVFLAGFRAKTLPVKMWETIRLEFTPVVAVAATLIVVLTVLLMGAVQVWRRGRREAPL